MRNSVKPTSDLTTSSPDVINFFFFWAHLKLSSLFQHLTVDFLLASCLPCEQSCLFPLTGSILPLFFTMLQSMSILSGASSAGCKWRLREGTCHVRAHQSWPHASCCEVRIDYFYFLALAPSYVCLVKRERTAPRLQGFKERNTSQRELQQFTQKPGVVAVITHL